MESIKKLIFEGSTQEAIRRLDEYITKYPDEDEAWFLRGNAYRKEENFQQALNNYLKAIELNPDSPAVQAHNMLIKILNYYNKETYNP